MSGLDLPDGPAVVELALDEFIGRPAWMAYGNCNGADPDLFFPERGDSTREAKEVCAHCTVRQQCLDYAIENGERFGIWGGKSERERRRLRRTFKPGQAGRRSAPRRRLLHRLADAGGVIEDFRGRAWALLGIDDSQSNDAAVMRAARAEGLVDIVSRQGAGTSRIALTDAGWAWLDRQPSDLSDGASA